MLDVSKPGLYAFPLFLALIALEAWWFARRGRGTYPWADAAASFAVAIGYKLSTALNPLIVGGLFVWMWEHRLATVPLDTWWGIPLLFVAVEFAYYWFHRFNHEIRWIWATHAVHHSPKDLTFSAAYRLGWTGLVSGGWLVFLPLVLAGFHPVAIFTALGLNLVYQFWLPTEMIGKLGVLEWVLNTPSHHRVHHAVNPGYLDRNYGGVVIVFDRLFGTFAAERAAEPCRYGLVKPNESRNPLRIVFNEWLGIGRDLRRAHGWRARFLVCFGRPGRTFATKPADAPTGAIVAASSRPV